MVTHPESAGAARSAETLDLDVLVVGAGFAGLYCSTACAAWGSRPR